MNRRENESEFEYHKRLIYSKLVDKTIDLDYSELAELVYGKEYHSDVARRMAYGSCKTLQLLDSEKREIVSNDERAEIDSKIIELMQERQRVSDQRREFKKLVSADGRRKHLEECLVDAANSAADKIGALYPIDRMPYQTFDSGKDMVLVLCDWHYGMVTNNIWNKYNTDVCVSRVKKLIESVTTRIKLHGCDNLHIVILGDMIHGAIHTSARVASEELACEQLMNVSEIIAQSITELSFYAENIYVYSAYGNHARTVQNKNDSIHRDNMERIIPWWLKHRLSSLDNVEVVEPSDTEFVTFSACGYNFCAVHGDLDYVKSSPRLISTLLQKKLGKDVHCVLLADKHHREEFEELGVTAMICSSLCGTDDYANGKRLYSTPEQLLLVVNKNDGIDATYKIKL